MILLSYWISLNAADTALTLIALDKGAIEANPAINMLAAYFGYLSTLVGKIVVAAVIGGIIWRYRKRHLVVVLNYGMLCVVIFNTMVITYAL